MKDLEHIARQLDRLAPAVDDNGQRPDNCEYPWEVGETVVVPADYSFPLIEFLERPSGQTILNSILPRAFSDEYDFLD